MCLICLGSKVLVALNAKIILSYDNYFFQQKITMSKLPANFERNPPFPFNTLNTLWPFHPPQQPNGSYNLPFPFFNNQLAYPYSLTSQRMFGPTGSAYYNFCFSQMQRRTRQCGLNVSISSLNEGLPKNNKKKKKTNEQMTVNLISDDEQPVQLQKPSQEKNTCNSNKIDQYNAPVLPAQNPNTKQKQKTETKIIEEEKIQPKEQQQTKNKKKKQIIKPAIINNKKKSKVLLTSKPEAEKKIFSQRIVVRQVMKKEPYRVSKRQRQLLQVSFLRDSYAVIMTGPQFQTKLPKFKADFQDRNGWLKNLKSDLLDRQYKEQQQ